MMNQGVTDTITTLDPNSLEHRTVDSSHGQTPSYYASSGAPESASWTMYDQRLEPQSTVASSGPGAANLEYANYATAPYPNNDPYGYGNTGYAGYYSNSYQQQPNHQSYPQQPNQSYPQQQQQQQTNQSGQTYGQPAGAYQSTGAPHQPISSFQNTGSYPGPASYSTTYYNPGDYQTSGGGGGGGYPTANYNNTQTNSWNQGSYPSYGHQYPNYTADSNVAAYSAQNNNTPVVASVQYQDYSKQWKDYYSQTEVTCAPGTENLSSTTAPNLVSPLPLPLPLPPPPPVPVPVPVSAYSAPSSHQMAAATSSWKPDSELPSVQPSAAINNVHESYWKQGYQHTGFQKPLDLNPVSGSFQNQQRPDQRPNLVEYTAPSHQPPPQTNTLPFDSSKVQIPTNPRISSNLPKNSNISKPAYVSVSHPNPNDNADSADKPGMLPKSLRGYVERALARCKDDRQMAACQNVLKELITKASTDGTLSTRDWDTEPLFPLPNTDTINNDSTPPSLMKTRSPSRRAKSRWEPLPEEKQTLFTPDSVKSIQTDKQQFSTGKQEKKENKFNNLRFFLSNQKEKETNKSFFRPAKRQHIGPNNNNNNNNNNNESSSDSDKEQNLTAYYASAITLADSPEEKKRRESRSKRFEKNPPTRTTPKPQKTKRAYSSLSRLATSDDVDGDVDSASRAVEDIDWDSLTVKGTCQEIEKRYLRLTSAPDPATVRPEEVLEKALVMVQDSQKNYLYKCDQLKSIRQDLTVQRIRNQLTVKVYETHARLAIEVGDMSEINQCQSQLQTLYGEGIKGCHMEFSAYNLLSVILHSNNNRDLLSAMSRLSVEARKDEAVKHALAVRAAVTAGNYVLFFRLYKNGPNLNTCLMDLYVEKMRYAAVKCMTRSYRPTLPVSYVAQVLGFHDGLDECTEWLKAHGAYLAMDNSGEMMIDAKASVASLFMPEPDDAVAHGDASLAVNDFLTRSL